MTVNGFAENFGPAVEAVCLALPSGTNDVVEMNYLEATPGFLADTCPTIGALDSSRANFADTNYSYNLQFSQGASYAVTPPQSLVFRLGTGTNPVRADERDGPDRRGRPAPPDRRRLRRRPKRRRVPGRKRQGRELLPLRADGIRGSPRQVRHGHLLWCVRRGEVHGVRLLLHSLRRPAELRGG